MNTVTRMTRNTVAAIALMTLGISTAAVAETQTITRGPNSAASIVKTVPLGAHQRTDTTPQGSPHVVKRGPNGAVHIVNAKPTERTASTPAGKTITRGPNGAAFIVN